MGRNMLAVGLLALSLQGCWVPQVVQGVTPDIFPDAPEATLESSSLSNEAKQVILATTMTSLVRTTAQSFVLSSEIASQRQALENHLFYNVKQNFSSWRFEPPQYRRLDTSTGAAYDLSFYTQSGQPYQDVYSGFDLMGLASYGADPLPAQDYPRDVTRFRLSSSHDLGQADESSDDDLKLTINGEWPVQIPLRGTFTTTLMGVGQVEQNEAFTDLEFEIDGAVTSDASVLSGQLSFSAEISGQSYNGFGQFTPEGFTSTVVLQQNGLPVLEIVPKGGSWEIVRNDVIEASVQ